jgi:hypothetical protein
MKHVTFCKAVPWLRQLVASLSPLRSGFAPKSTHLGFVVDKLAMGQVFLRVLWSYPVHIIPPWLSMLIYHLEDEQYARWWQLFRDVVCLH